MKELFYPSCIITTPPHKYEPALMRGGKGVMTEKWRITVPVEGFDFPIRGKFDIQGTIVESYLSIDNEMEPMISVDVDGERNNAIAIGRALLDGIAARLSFSSEKEIRLKKEVYLTRLQPETGRQMKGWGYHDYQRTVSSTLSIGDRYGSMVRFVGELEFVKQDKQDVISRAVAYYREASTSHGESVPGNRNTV
jgi:hypothetical protein